MFTKYFTPLKATRTLPLVKKIVGEILGKGKRLRADGQRGGRRAGDRQWSDRALDYRPDLQRLGHLRIRRPRNRPRHPGRHRLLPVTAHTFILDA